MKNEADYCSLDILSTVVDEYAKLVCHEIEGRGEATAKEEARPQKADTAKVDLRAHEHSRPRLPPYLCLMI